MNQYLKIAYQIGANAAALHFEKEARGKLLERALESGSHFLQSAPGGIIPGAVAGGIAAEEGEGLKGALRGAGLGALFGGIGGAAGRRVGRLFRPAREAGLAMSPLYGQAAGTFTGGVGGGLLGA